MKKDCLYPLRVLHGRIHEWCINFLPWIKKRIQNPRAVFLVFTPEHGNLGDHAIAQAEKELLGELGIPVIEITGKELISMKYKRNLRIMNGRSVLIHGGGYLGTIWFDSELLLREIIESNPRSHIIMMPNTIYYEKSDWGNEEEKKSVKIYNNHKKLHIYAREKPSFALMSKLYHDVKLVPDMALLLNKSTEPIRRKGCILCLRNDREKTRDERTDRIIRKFSEDLFGESIRRRDMVVGHPIPIEKRNYELNQQYEVFRGAELVITDRLHGMIFSAITGTPCIVIDSMSPKLRGCYEWIKDLNYIQFCDAPDKIYEIYNKMPKGENQYNPEVLRPLFEPLIKDILFVTKK